MSHFLRRMEENDADHDVSKELFLGIMMLMLCLGIMILNVAQPVWRVHQHNPEKGDVVVVYTPGDMGLSTDGYTIHKKLSEFEFRRQVLALISEPGADLHLFRRGGSKERMLVHAAFADSLLSTGPAGDKVLTAVYLHTW